MPEIVEAPPPAPPRPSRRSLDWRPPLRRFASEFVVVVAGVLTALALQAWYAGRQEAARERGYLRQIVADLHAAETSLDRSIQNGRQLERAASLLLRAYHDPERADADSVRRWLWAAPWLTPNPAQLVSLRSLAAGDLQLIRDDSVRNGALALLDRSEYLAAGERFAIESFHASYETLRAEASFVEGWAVDLGPVRADSLARADETFPFPPGAAGHPFPTDVQALLRSHTAYRALEGLWESNHDLRRAQQERRDGVRRLRGVVERALAR